ncbi:chemotaxis protein CheC [Carboxydothermus islandicus]|uniref:Chemotaxis protein CheC n=1 Tax=Carboxydothermus islandicus TaxID=661089 RepID=A0A1L8D533_9THEO|nr:chemotaxis protein CheC [Carboxydothermus islandicus]GAV26181.1 chemotaxis protein CheC [Carboxydothermus islandicus]
MAEANDYLKMDALKEIGNIGIANAATALAQFLARRIDMDVPEAVVIGFDEILQRIGSPEELVACVFLGIKGDAPGTILFIFNQESTNKLLKIVIGTETTGYEMDEFSASALKEICNILAGSFAQAIGSLTGLTLLAEVPLFSYDMLAATLSTGLIASGAFDDQVLVIDTNLIEQGEKIKGHFFFVPKPGSLQKIFAALGLS